jgi:Ni/Fe-hydrogenase 1 B-type cytochrome subunit
MSEAAAKNREIIYMKVWEAPVIITHWIMVIAIVVLGITGYWIGNPYFSEPTEASKIYTFGTIRFLHVVAGYVLLANFIIRLYWGFVGNHFSRWTTMMPITKKRWRAMFEEAKFLLYPRGVFHVYTGHAPLANISYLFVYLAVAFSIVSGFTLYAQGQYSPFWRMVSEWGLALFGYHLNTIHFLHHLLLWFFAIFLVIHLYLAVYAIVVSRTTEIDTLISGKKFVFKEEISPESE